MTRSGLAGTCHTHTPSGDVVWKDDKTGDWGRRELVDRDGNNTQSIKFQAVTTISVNVHLILSVSVPIVLGLNT